MFYKFSIILVALILSGIWLFGLFFSSFLVENINSNKTAYYPLWIFLIGFPVLLIFSIYLFWSKNSFTPVFYSMLLLLALMACGGITGFVKDKRMSNFRWSEDQSWAKHELEGVVTLEVPQSFELNKDQMLKNFYGMDGLQGNRFYYHFVRGAYSSTSGVKEKPVQLFVEVYDPAFESIGKAGDVFPFDYENFKYVDHPHTDASNTSFARSEDGSGKRQRHLYRYWDSDGRFTLTLVYRKKYINPELALNLLLEIAPKVSITGSWKKRLDDIKEAFYKKYPDKKPISGN